MKRVIGFLVGWVVFFQIGCGNEPMNAEMNTEQYLREFHEDPVKVMNTPPVHLDEEGRPDREDPLANGELTFEELLAAKDKVRADICARAGVDCRPSSSDAQVFAGFARNDRVEDFLHQVDIVRRLNEMEQRNLTSAQLKEVPWSDSYWPIQKGMIARRFSHSGFPSSSDWGANYGSYLATPASAIATTNLSPSEKYDLLVGDTSYRLTRENWDKGQYYYKRYGTVPAWMGLCHGWAPASYMLKRPMKAVTLTGAGGHQITFYPSDIKALATAAWGEISFTKASRAIKFIGSRCRATRPDTDDVGRVTDETCFDSNPGSWHVAVVNQLGISQRSFVMDSTFDYQVWNYPIYAYSYSYFNPQTLAVSKNLARSAVPISDFTIDKFKRHRSPEARFVVGISMNVTYANVVQPSRGQGGSSNKTVRYVYDLELDGNYRIVGGEWYSNFHPDFIWNPKPDARPVSQGEVKHAPDVQWSGHDPIPSELIQAARVSSAQREPVYAIIEALVRLATEE